MTGRRSIWSPMGLVLLCSHCALGGLVGALGLLGVITLPTLFGLSLHWFWPPVVLLSAFAWLVWGGRESSPDAASCALPGAACALSGAASQPTSHPKSEDGP